MLLCMQLLAAFFFFFYLRPCSLSRKKRLALAASCCVELCVCFHSSSPLVSKTFVFLQHCFFGKLSPSDAPTRRNLSGTQVHKHWIQSSILKLSVVCFFLLLLFVCLIPFHCGNAFYPLLVTLKILPLNVSDFSRTTGSC